jgi:hypothetical protein
MDRRNMLKFLGGVGLGAIAAETYEALHHIPQLERRFVDEVNYWINQYNSAKDAVDKLSNKLRQQEGEISNLKDEENYWRAQYSSKSEEVGKLTLTVNKLDELERESTSSISYYREKMGEVIKRLRETIEKYRAILGDERVSFESSTLKVLEDLKLSQEKLLKLLPYFPLIRNLSWRPSRVINDKIYDIRVELEVISPLNTLAEVEVSLIPVEYEYFITRYGMRREDYPKAFPPEETKTVKLRPAGLERETYNVEFKDITGGREYSIRVIAKDVADSTNSEERKIPYIREFENLGKVLYDRYRLIVMSDYLPFNMRSIPHKDDVSLLGRYDTLDEVVLIKHVDWSTGYGINTFIADSQNHWWSTSPKMKERVFQICRKLLSFEQVKVAWIIGPSPHDFIYGKLGGEIPEWAIDLKIPQNVKTFLRFVEELVRPDIMSKPSYLKINSKPVLYIWDEGAFFNQEDTYLAVKRLFVEKTGREAYIIGDWLPRIPTLPSDGYVQFLLQKYRGAGLRVIDAFTSWIGFHRVGVDTQEYVDRYEYYYNKQLDVWKDFTKKWGKDFIVPLTPGFDNSYSWGGAQIPLPRGSDKFAERLKIAIRYLDNHRPMLKIDTWNDFGEWSYVEPTQKEAFTYLEKLREVLLAWLNPALNI